MKSLDNVITAILAHLRSWPAFYADPGRTPGDSDPGGRTPPMPPASAAPMPDGRTPGGRAWDGRPLSHRTPIGRRCYRVAPTEWGSGLAGSGRPGSGLPVTASPPAEETPSRPDLDPPVRQAPTAGPPARRRGASLLGASRLPQPRGLLTCSPQAAERSRRPGGGISLG